jgi:hypothetical protein
MKRLAVLGGTFLMVCTLAGCGADPREEEITKAITFFGRAADDTRALKDLIAKKVDAAKKNKQQLTEADFKLAEESAKKLHDVGKQLLESKGQIDLLQDKTTAEEKQRLDEKFGPQLQSLFDRLNKAQRELDATLAEAAKYSTPAAMTELRKAIDDSREEFRILTKPR